MSYPQYYFPFTQQPNYNQNQQQNTQQIQSGGFIPVSSEEMARNYPVAPGNSITFKNENAPYVYTKTMGFSQLDRPIFEKFKLVREEEDPPVITDSKTETDNKALDDMKAEITALQNDIKALQDEVNAIRQRKTKEIGGDRHNEQSK